ncbi:3-phosphoshikimate 1-carboxyvinyltransferase [Candidatus Bilamarchaeum dharawalense]|uniref:3-phosphoshikimate 1-carboxyvinyltransferase n=1 Tax=Candidatus Bilamarchaeum dharawalense TaxID=2885759 RepID=A0A5E4LV57_9ARCH|nr:3-phosphoshikimate 1-carboxyvinyltransferase [Candidatus Bilamarchaeum dharawalense]
MKIMPGNIKGEITAPPSKSMMQRAVAIAALANGTTEITNPSFCDDSLASIEIARALGAEVDVHQDMVKISSGVNEVKSVLNCNESGLCMRMFSPIAALFDKQLTITGTGSLLSRPVGMIEEPLKRLGVDVKTNNGVPPVKVTGPMHGGQITVDGGVSSQFLSGLLIALPLCKEDSEVDILDLKSKDYVSMTESMILLFGANIWIDDEMKKASVSGNQQYIGKKYRVEGDWSGAAFMLVAGAIAGEVNINQLESSIQPDQMIKSALVDAGAELEFNNNEVFVSRGELRAFEFDATNSPDLFPPLVALACNCKGKTIIHGVSRLAHKESNRAQVLVNEFTRMGAEIRIDGDRMEIMGKPLKGGTVDSNGDHRIAMACAIAALRSELGVEIRHPECVSKSYPKFFQDLKRISNEEGLRDLGLSGEQK